MKLWKFYLFLYGIAVIIPVLIGIYSYFEYYYTVNTIVFTMKDTMFALVVTMTIAFIINFIILCCGVSAELERLEREVERLERKVEQLKR